LLQSRKRGICLQRAPLKIWNRSKTNNLLQELLGSNQNAQETHLLRILSSQLSLLRREFDSSLNLQKEQARNKQLHADLAMERAEVRKLGRTVLSLQRHAEQALEIAKDARETESRHEQQSKSLQLHLLGAEKQLQMRTNELVEQKTIALRWKKKFLAMKGKASKQDEENEQSLEIVLDVIATDHRHQPELT